MQADGVEDKSRQHAFVRKLNPKTILHHLSETEDKLWSHSNLGDSEAAHLDTKTIGSCIIRYGRLDLSHTCS